MALIKCEECGKELSDKAGSCPNCGCPVIEKEEKIPQQVEVTGVKLNGKKIRKVLIGFIFVTILVVAGLITYKNQQISKEKEARNLYIDNLSLVQITMLDGGSDAEELSNLTAKVWYNSIYEKSDAETDKYTKTKSGRNFNTDFNKSLEVLFSDDTIKTVISDIELNQTTVSSIMKELQTPPSDLEKCYETVSELYSSYQGLTGLSINPTGSMQSFTDSKSEKVDTFMEYYNKLDTQIPEKIK